MDSSYSNSNMYFHLGSSLLTFICSFITSNKQVNCLFPSDLENKLRLAKEEESLSKSEDDERRRVEEEEAMVAMSAQMQVIKQDNEQIQMVAAEMERIEGEVQDAKEIFTDLAQLVHTQGNNFQYIENNNNSSNTNNYKKQ